MNGLSLGKKIQEIRSAKGFSVRKTANLAEITPSMLSQIENDLVNPSINTLRCIANALDTPIYMFFREEDHESPVVHPEDRLSLGFKSAPDVRYELLTPDDIQRDVIDKAGADLKAFEHVNYCLAVRKA